MSFNTFFTDIGDVCDLVSVYSLGKGLGLGPIGPSVIPAAISTESSKIFSQFNEEQTSVLSV